MSSFRSTLFAIFLLAIMLPFPSITAQGYEFMPGMGEPIIKTVHPAVVSPSLLPGAEKQSSWETGADIMTSYIWRGTRQGRGLHLQPWTEYSAGPFTGGVWGTFDLHGYREVDLYLSFGLPGGFALSLQDYWMADQPLFDFSAGSGSHALEAGIGYESDNVGFYAGYVLNEAGGAGSYGSDLYLEGRFSFDYFTVVMGAGNGWHTEDGRFNVCNLGLELSEEINIGSRLIIPVTASANYNPDTGQLFLWAGISFSVSTGD